MNRNRRKLIRQLAFLLIATGVYVLRFGSTDLGATVTIRTTNSVGFDGNCDEQCGPDVSCDQGCWAQAPELPSFHTTCGEYSGSPWNGEGMCLGECGDYYCNPYNDEDGDTCYVDCGACGDGVCNGPEDLGSCPEDCHVCEDTYCSGPYETCSNCPADCNPDQVTCGGDQPGTPDGCDEGQYQNAEGYCCETELLYEGLNDCHLCNENQYCMPVYLGGTFCSGEPPERYCIWYTNVGWGCIGRGETCGQRR